MRIEDKDANLSTFCNVSGLCADDQAILARIAPLVFPSLPALTNRFYEELANDQQTSLFIEGKIDALKKTHMAWMQDLFSGDYGEAFLIRQEKIGHVHVAVKIPPVFVAASMSFLRGALPAIIAELVADKNEAAHATSAILRLLDLCQYLIDRSYTQTMMDNLGISPALLNRLMTTK
ncbi:hypothetical protein HFQ13_09350 [Acidithiobacillus sp. VAN18-1]|uniref:Globin-sensor domain-containing protein n=1 Tax=Igneacidithiobacillus copahuensis TaxID=2724909 RepID=A0AAE3CK18_9PROT|nr:protoglobin domain-containing protein [Igneacidithiobacillus copahuensis]MBU2788403.1 hypothetical protein [Igneacidithiobacillus copahuensis]MBU2796928.1 hypothetical protein [Acidithiobacillus sp. VAN18-2]